MREVTLLSARVQQAIATWSDWCWEIQNKKLHSPSLGWVPSYFTTTKNLTMVDIATLLCSTSFGFCTQLCHACNRLLEALFHFFCNNLHCCSLLSWWHLYLVQECIISLWSFFKPGLIWVSIFNCVIYEVCMVAPNIVATLASFRYSKNANPCTCALCTRDTTLDSLVKQPLFTTSF